ncbi:MAG: hypothetical protein WA417_20735 [Stellaceae bacterium]
MAENDRLSAGLIRHRPPATPPGGRPRRRYRLLGNGEAVLLWCEPTLIFRGKTDPLWVEFERWRRQPGNLTEPEEPA